MCLNGRCTCPAACVDIEAPVCGSDDQTYRTECHLKLQACRDNSTDLIIKHPGSCRPPKVDPIEIRPPIKECLPADCRYGGNCELDISDGIVKCLCSNFTCLEIRDPVCGSDGKLYGNQCELYKVACQLQKPITKVPLSECQSNFYLSKIENQNFKIQNY